MKKYLIAAVCILIVISIAIFTVPSLRVIRYRYMIVYRARDNENFDAETNRQIKNLVYQFMIARYIYGFRDESIFTESWWHRRQIQITPRGFLISVNRDYMASLRAIDEDRFSLFIRFNCSNRGTMNDSLLDSYNLWLGFARMPDGTYLISSWGIDP